MTTLNYSVVIRDAPKSVNQGGAGSRQHPHQAAKEKRRWEALFLAEFMTAKVKKHMSHCAVDVTLHFRRRNHRDEENYRAGIIKPLGDALQQGQYLEDDTKQWFTVAGFELIEASEPWPSWGLWLWGYTVIELEATYE